MKLENTPYMAGRVALRGRNMKTKFDYLRTNLPFLAGLALLYALLYISFIG